MSSLLDQFRKASGEAFKEKVINSEKRNYDNEDDPRIYYPQRDDKKQANVVIRFLPQKDPNKIPFIKVNSHGFIGDDGRWLIETCPRSFKAKCPVCDAQAALWSTGLEEKKEIYRKRKIRKAYACNVLVIKDPLSPEKEGKVFVFRFGASIFKMIMSQINPEFDTDTAINPFDIFNGADFLMRIMVDPNKKMTTYEHSKFKNPAPICNGNEAEIEKVLEQLYDLDEIFNLNMCISETELTEKTINAYSKCIPSFTASIRKEPTSINISANISNSQHGTELNNPVMEVNVGPSENKQKNDLDEFRALLEQDNEVDEVPF